jgi:CRP-like cAMP-binding protein
VRRPSGSVILDPAKPLDALYVVVDGAVELNQNGDVMHVARQNDVLGAWGLFDDAPLPVTARTVDDTRLLRISREDFYELLSDNVEITANIFSTLVKRFRRLVEQ